MIVCHSLVKIKKTAHGALSKITQFLFYPLFHDPNQSPEIKLTKSLIHLSCIYVILKKLAKQTVHTNVRIIEQK